MINLLSFVSFNTSLFGLCVLFLWLYFGSYGFPAVMFASISFGTAATNFEELLLVIVFAYIAMVLGDISVYEISRKLSDSVVSRIRKFDFFRKGEEKIDRMLKKYEFWLIFFTRFALVGLCVPMSYISGIKKLNRNRYYRAVFTGELLYAIIYPTIGFALGVTFGNLIRAINDVVIVIVLGVILLYALFELGRHMIKRKK